MDLSGWLGAKPTCVRSPCPAFRACLRPDTQLLVSIAVATTLHVAVAAFATTPSLPPQTFSRHAFARSRQGFPSNAVVTRFDTKSTWKPSFGPNERPLVLSLSAAESTKKGTSSAGPGDLGRRAATPGRTVAALCAVGCVLGLYALYVGSMATASPPVGGRAAKSGFKAWCDFSTGASCSTVARSQYGVGLGLIKPHGPFWFLALPNSVYGIIYYVAMLFTQLPSTFAVPRARQIALILSSGALFASFYLGYLLVFVIKNLCVVCVATYIVNGALFKLSISDYQAVLMSLRTSRKSPAVGARAKGLVMSDREALGAPDRAGPGAADAGGEQADAQHGDQSTADKTDGQKEQGTKEQAASGARQTEARMSEDAREMADDHAVVTTAERRADEGDVTTAERRADEGDVTTAERRAGDGDEDESERHDSVDSSESKDEGKQG